MRITKQQQGAIAQNEFAKFAMMGSGGEIELNPAMTDDDGRDLEIHRRRKFGPSASIQVKSTLKLMRDYRQMRLERTFLLPNSEVGGDPRFWFFFAYLDPRDMGLADPCFLVPSLDLFRLAPSRRVDHRLTSFEFHASMSPLSRDKWSRYQVETRHIGRELLVILRRVAAAG